MSDIATHYFITEVNDQGFHRVGQSAGCTVSILVTHRAPNWDKHQKTKKGGQKHEHDVFRWGQINCEPTNMYRLKVRKRNHKTSPQDLKLELTAIQEMVQKHPLKVWRSFTGMSLSGLLQCREEGEEFHL